MGLQFKKATKEAGRLRMALIGPAGGGKTFTALRIATHLGGPVALLDTERGSASKYAGESLADGTRFEFDVMEPDTFSPDTYVQAIRAAESQGYNVLIIDSLSHAWMGKGGALEMVDNAAKRTGGGNKFAGWRDVTPKHNEMVDAIVSSRLHIIATMRSKMEYVQEKDEKGKTIIRKVGLQPVQRDGLEYEFDVICDLDQDNNLIVGKTRCSALSGMVIQKAGREIAEKLKMWLTDGASPMPPEREVLASQASPEVAAAIHAQEPLSPEERREAKVQDIYTTCSLLNEKGDKIEMPGGVKLPWKSKSLAAFVNSEFHVEDGLQSLSFDSLQKLQGMLSRRLDKYIEVDAPAVV